MQWVFSVNTCTTDCDVIITFIKCIQQRAGPLYAPSLPVFEPPKLHFSSSVQKMSQIGVKWLIAKMAYKLAQVC